MSVNLKNIVTPVIDRWGSKKTQQIAMLSLMTTSVAVFVGDIVIPDCPKVIELTENLINEGD